MTLNRRCSLALLMLLLPSPCLAGPADQSVEAWVQTLAEKLTDHNERIRTSAEQGLLAVGPLALPVLKQIANGNDAAQTEAVQRLLARMTANTETSRRDGGLSAPRLRQGGPQAGASGPDFELKYLASDRTFRLSDNFGRRPTVLIFHSFT